METREEIEAALAQLDELAKIPTEANPNRPVLYEEEYQAMLNVAHDVDWRFAVALVLANETGHRVGAIRGLTWSDIDFSSGWIHWRLRAALEQRTELDLAADG